MRDLARPSSGSGWSRRCCRSSAPTPTRLSAFRVLGLMVVALLVTTVLFARWPVVRTSRTETLRVAGSSGQWSAGCALLVVELGLSVMLLAGVAWLIQPLWNLQRVDPGFRTERDRRRRPVDLPCRLEPPLRDASRRAGAGTGVLDRGWARRRGGGGRQRGGGRPVPDGRRAHRLAVSPRFQSAAASWIPAGRSEPALWRRRRSDAALGVNPRIVGGLGHRGRVLAHDDGTIASRSFHTV